MTGLHRQLLDAEGRIVPAAWKQAVETLQIVGACPTCKGPMLGEKAHQVRTVVWYNATCVYCGRDITAPNGMTLTRAAPVT